MLLVPAPRTNQAVCLSVELILFGDHFPCQAASEAGTILSAHLLGQAAALRAVGHVDGGGDYVRHSRPSPRWHRIKQRCLMLGTILMVFAFVLLLLAAFNIPSPPRLNLGWLGMACWALAIV